ncbi:MAG: prepilin-type N-terminal cleavage/methylation domain-containing protein [Burkholderiales bacterium]|nr:prepilin-type N-terminal cleavage/methylation domain-containing protein [Burkholderiales bacterium]
MRGYTMVEMIVVMVIMGILGAVAIPALSSLTPVHEAGMRDQVGAMLEYCRKLAVVQQRGVCVQVLAGTVQAVYVAPAGNACQAASPVPSPDGAAQFSLPVPSDVAMGGDALVQFDQNGRIAGNVPLTITMGGTRSVTISNETSLVTYL